MSKESLSWITLTLLDLQYLAGLPMTHGLFSHSLTKFWEVFANPLEVLFLFFYCYSFAEKIIMVAHSGPVRDRNGSPDMQVSAPCTVVPDFRYSCSSVKLGIFSQDSFLLLQLWAHLICLSCVMLSTDGNGDSTPLWGKVCIHFQRKCPHLFFFLLIMEATLSALAQKNHHFLLLELCQLSLALPVLCISLCGHRVVK